MAVKWFSSVAAFLLLLLAIYGMIGAIFNYNELTSITPNNGKWPFNQKPIYKVFICIQLCYLVAAVLGITAAIKDSNLYFLWSVFLLLGIFSTLLIFGVVCLRVSLLDLRSDIYKAFRKNLTDEKDVEWLFDIQYLNQCCGIYSYMDWSAFQIKLPNGNTSVPNSCCKRGIYYAGSTCGAGHLVPGKTIAETEMFIYTKGCSPVISQMLWNTSKWIGGEMVIAAVFTIAVAIFIYSGVMKTYCASDEIITPSNVDSENQGSNNENCSRSAIVNRTRRRSGSGSSGPGKGYSGNANRPPNVQDSNNNISRESCTRLQNGSRNYRGNSSQRNSLAVSENSHYNRKRAIQNKMKSMQINQNFNSGSQSFVFSESMKGENAPFSRKFITAYTGGLHNEENLTNSEFMLRQNMEMLMNPLEGTFSTLSTTPHPSGSLNFLAFQQSISPTPVKVKAMDKIMKEPNLSHYASLPLVTTHMNNNFSDRERDSDLLNDNHFYNGSHYHPQRTQEYPNLSPEPATTVNFVPGKFASPSLTVSTTLATIHEETESLKSGTASTSPKAASPNSTPHSLSEKSSTSCSEDSTPLQSSLLYEGPQSIVIDIVDAEKKSEEYSEEFMKDEIIQGKTESTTISLQLKPTKEFSIGKSSSEDQNENINQCLFSSVNENISSENSEFVRIPINLNACVGITRKDSTYIGTNNKTISETVPLNREIMSGQENAILSFESYNANNYALDEPTDMVAL